MDTNSKVTKNVVLQWGELPTSVGEETLDGCVCVCVCVCVRAHARAWFLFYVGNQLLYT